VRPGAVFVPFVKLAESAANFLTNSAHDPTSKIPEYKVCAVRVEPVRDVDLRRPTTSRAPGA
jgi:assimilatory nitrate reductase catalytic subunit